ncbi:hypothetical protein I79_017568 [Cricetulus griseus]|uniref:Uncharacterized protein n=1 Tax=Cricetulus griseus TaxID=10029 RepID=G3I2D9_CRIGR|nr:hypothetical protein I79_017568 [Cricetulus griseus]
MERLISVSLSSLVYRVLLQDSQGCYTKKRSGRRWGTPDQAKSRLVSNGYSH